MRKDLQRSAATLVCGRMLFANSDFLTPWVAHAWTIFPSILPMRVGAPQAGPWSTTLEDPDAGTITLNGELRVETGTRASQCVVVIHGLGGSYDRPYGARAARAAQRAGFSCLRFNLRGADRSGQDFYHAGLYADLEAAVKSDALAQFGSLYVLGYSMGGHVALHYATQQLDPRIRAVAAVCAPLDLDRSAIHIDDWSSYIYRHHVLQGLKDIYRAVGARRPVPTPMTEALRAQRMRDWDRLTVVPRYKFESAEDYYERMSVGPRLRQLQRPSLLVQSSVDPMIPPWTYEHHLRAPHPQLEVLRLHTGGHVSFPRVSWRADGAKAELEDHLLQWFSEQRA